MQAGGGIITWALTSTNKPKDMTNRALGPYIWKNGEFLESSSVTIHACTHSLHYSGSVFEGIACYYGAIFKLKEHVQRLFSSASLVSLRLGFEVPEVVDAIKALVQMNSCKDGRFYIRPIVWCDGSDLSIRKRSEELAQIAIFTKEIRPLNPNAEVNLVLSSWTKASGASSPHQCKTSGNYLTSILAKRESEKFGGGEALLLDFTGKVAECGSANIFFLQKNGILLTPKTNCCLNGITRQTVLELAPKLGIDAQEKDIFLTDLNSVSEVFLTGTAIGILPVRSLFCPKDGLRLEFSRGPVASLLFEAYFKLVSSKHVT